MAVNRVSTSGIHQVTLANAIRLQAGIFQTQEQISSGLKANSFAALNGQVEQYVTLENKLAKTVQYKDGNALIQSRLDTTNAVLGQIIESANDAKNLILQRRNQTTAGSLAFGQQAEGYFKTIAGQLNLSQEGRYLFSGASTDQKPVDDTNFPSLQEQGVPDRGYYRGSTKDITARIQDDFELTYNTRADDEGFQKIFAALVMAKQGDEERDDDKLAQAYTLMQQGIDRVINLQAANTTNASIVAKASERNQALDVYYKSFKEEIVNADIIGLSTKLAVDQGVLQASFQAFARINSLQLSNFLT